MTKKRHLSSLLINTSEGGKGGAKPPPVTVIPLLLSTDAFAAAWRDWLQHRRENKNPIEPGSQTERQQLKTLEQWGEERAIAAIRYTIFKGWRGIREPDPNDKEYASVAGRKPAPRPDIYTEPPNWRDHARAKWGDTLTLPDTWAELSASVRNDLLAYLATKK